MQLELYSCGECETKFYDYSDYAKPIDCEPCLTERIVPKDIEIILLENEGDNV